MASPNSTRVRHTAASIEALEPGAKRYRVEDSEVRGLSVVVMPTGSKRWQCRYTRDGKQHTFVIGDATVIRPNVARKRAQEAVGTHAQALKIEARQQAKAEREAQRQAEHRTVYAYLTKVYEPHHLRPQKSGKATHDRILSVWKPLLDRDMAAITEADVRRVVNQRRSAGAAVGTLRRDVGALRALMNEAQREGLIENVRVPSFKEMTLPKPDGRVRYLSEDERQRFMAALAADETPAHIRIMVTLAMNTGLRRGEIFGLRWGDLDLPRRQLTVDASNAKTDRRRHVQLNEAAVQALTEWRGVVFGDSIPGPGSQAKLVFESQGGARYVTIKTAWASLLQRAGISDFRLHDCRHDFASRLVMAGVDLYRVAALLGHSDIVMTQRYAHLAPDSLQAAVDMLVEAPA